jgi:hypothetical protein
MIISSLDSGKIFYNYYYSKSINAFFKEEYLLRLLIGLFLGGVSLCYVLNKKNQNTYILFFCLLILIAERTYDEIQRFLISDKNYKKWSLMQISRSLLYLALMPLLFLGASHEKGLSLCIILLMPTLLVSLYFISSNNKLMFQTIKKIINNFKITFSQTIQNWKPCLIGLAGSSLTLPKNILLIAFGNENINNLHLLFSICSLQSLYIFSFFLIKNRWKVLQDSSGHSIIDKRFYINLAGSSFFILICGLFFFYINLISKSLIFYFPFIIASEYLLNLNSTKRDILFYQREKTDLLKADALILCLFCGLAFLMPKTLACGLLLLIITEIIRNGLYKNKLSQ